ncbi:MAG: hypothetical protein AMXMBFR84_49550 [Candidatus Hydrogenedentota bacterium]
MKIIDPHHGPRSVLVQCDCGQTFSVSTLREAVKCPNCNTGVRLSELRK